MVTPITNAVATITVTLNPMITNQQSRLQVLKVTHHLNITIQRRRFEADFLALL